MWSDRPTDRPTALRLHTAVRMWMIYVLMNLCPVALENTIHARIGCNHLLTTGQLIHPYNNNKYNNKMQIPPFVRLFKYFFRQVSPNDAVRSTLRVTENNELMDL